MMNYRRHDNNKYFKNDKAMFIPFLLTAVEDKWKNYKQSFLMSFLILLLASANSMASWTPIPEFTCPTSPRHYVDPKT